MRRWTVAVSDLVFPPVCACCGQLTFQRSDIICYECLSTRFEPDVRNDSIILPKSVAFRYSLWKFDKMGYLQNLLHKLKYDHLTSVGFSLGRELGKQLIKSGYIESHFSSTENLILVPVPLYKKRLRKRGYNQSRLISEGINNSTGINIIQEHSILRCKNTATQTGLNSEKRIRNLSKAFRVNKYEVLTGRIPIIVDDVYTTGATTFELAATLSQYTTHQSAIVTVART